MKVYEPKLFNPFNVENGLGKCSVKIGQDKYYLKRYTINVFSDKTKYNLGFEDLVFYPDNNEIIGEMIQTNFRYRNKYKIGEVMRLASIMELMENKLDAIKIFSKKTAVYFHSKYGFEPSFKFGERGYLKDLVQDVLHDEHPDFREFKEAIKYHYSKKQYNECGRILKEYYKRVLEGGYDQEKHQASSGLYMKLTAEKIKNNADFYNKLFEKHGIDYKI